MQARVGDHILIPGHRLGQPDHDGEIVEVRGKNGEPPYIVRWGHTDHDTLFFPGPDAIVEHIERPE